MTGYSIGVGSSRDYATIKYSNAGIPLWTNRHGYGTNTWDVAVAVVVDEGDNVIVTGYPHYTTLGYSNDGQPLWTNSYHGPASGENDGLDEPQTKLSLAVGPDNTVLVTGVSDGNYAYGALTYDIATVKFAPGSPPTALEILQTGPQVILIWSNSSFELQSAPLVHGPYTNVPNAASPHTNAITELQKFFRLKRN